MSVSEDKADKSPGLSGAVGLLVVAAATISAATISVGSAGYLGVFMPVCTENPIRVEEVTLSWRNDRATLFRSGRVGFASQVEEPT
jgi:amino acid transporter